MGEDKGDRGEGREGREGREGKEVLRLVSPPYQWRGGETPLRRRKATGSTSILVTERGIAFGLQ